MDYSFKLKLEDVPIEYPFVAKSCTQASRIASQFMLKHNFWKGSLHQYVPSHKEFLPVLDLSPKDFIPKPQNDDEQSWY